VDAMPFAFLVWAIPADLQKESVERLKSGSVPATVNARTTVDPNTAVVTITTEESKAASARPILTAE